MPGLGVSSDSVTSFWSAADRVFRGSFSHDEVDITAPTTRTPAPTPTPIQILLLLEPFPGVSFSTTVKPLARVPVPTGVVTETFLTPAVAVLLIVMLAVIVVTVHSEVVSWLFRTEARCSGALKVGAGDGYTERLP